MGIFSVFKKTKINEIDDNLEIKEITNNEKHEKEKSYGYNFQVKDIDDKNETEIEAIISDEDLDRIIIGQIIKVIDNHKDFSSIEDSAKESVAVIGLKNVSKLKDYLVGKVSKPSVMKGRYEGLGDWPMVVENSVLAIIYCYEAAGVDELLKIAISNTTTKFKAINLLCKLAARGIDRDKIIDSIIYIMKPLKEEEVIKVLGFLSQVKNHPKVERLLNLYYKKFIFEKNFNSAYDTILSITNFKGKCTVEHLTFLKAIALHEGEIDIELIIKDESGVVNIKDIDQSLKINAALSFYSLNSDDKEIRNMLLYLMENSLDNELREYLNSIL